MKFLVFIPAFLALASAAPTTASKPNLSAVKLRIISTDSNHYAASNQNPTTDPGRTISILVGQTLSLDQDPLLAQGFEIVDITEGQSLSKQKVGQNDANVWCKASLDFASRGLKFTMKNQVETLDEGKVVQVTGLACGLGENSV